MGHPDLRGTRFPSPGPTGSSDSPITTSASPLSSFSSPASRRAACRPEEYDPDLAAVGRFVFLATRDYFVEVARAFFSLWTTTFFGVLAIQTRLLLLALNTHLALIGFVFFFLRGLVAILAAIVALFFHFLLVKAAATLISARLSAEEFLGAAADKDSHQHRPFPPERTPWTRGAPCFSEVLDMLDAPPLRIRLSRTLLRAAARLLLALVRVAERDGRSSAGPSASCTATAESSTRTNPVASTVRRTPIRA